MAQLFTHTYSHFAWLKDLAWIDLGPIHTQNTYKHCLSLLNI